MRKNNFFKASKAVHSGNRDKINEYA